MSKKISKEDYRTLFGTEQLTKGILKYDLRKEDFPWLDEDWKQGMAVYKYHDCTYNMVSANGIAVSRNEDASIPWREVPKDSVEWE